jgi:SPP1 family phage portal protein
MTTQDWIDLIETYKVKNESEVIASIIESNKSTQDAIHTNWLHYKGDVPIKDRTLAVGNEHKLNNKISNDFRGHNVDQCNGYMFATPIVYQFDDQAQTDTLTKWHDRNNIEDLDSITGTYQGACGYAVRLLYIDSEGTEKVKNSNPWEYIFIENGSIEEVEYVLRYYDVDYWIDNAWQKRRKVEWYDNTTITYYISADDKLNENVEYVKDDTEKQNPQFHMFDLPPVVKFKNNELEQSDFHKSADKIDAFDRVVSDCQNEIEEFRLAYMLFFGINPDIDDIERARAAGAFGLGAEDRVEFLTKTINDVFVQNTKATLEEGIYRDGRAVNMSDEKFSGSAQSGESRRWKLIDLENKAKKKERKFKRGTQDELRILSTAWAKKKIIIDPETLTMTFTRTLPVDLLYEAEVQQKLNGIVPDELRLAQASFVDDPAETANQLKAEMPEIDLDTIVDEDV